MRAAGVSSLLISFSLASNEEQTFPAGQAGVNFDEIYGPLEPKESMDRWADRPEFASQQNYDVAEYEAVRTPEKCEFALEVVVLQDSTGSFADDIRNMKNVQIPEMFNHLRNAHPGTKFSVLSFRDKPVGQLGSPGDYCVRFDTVNTGPEGGMFTERLEDLTAAYGKMYSSGGMDPPENQMGALIAAAQSSELWRDSNPLATKLFVLSTDANPHFSDDGFNQPSYNMSPFSGVWDEANPAEQCVKEYYPSPDQVKAALQERQAYLAQMIYDSDYQNHLPRRAWEWFNSHIEQTPEFISLMKEDSSDFWIKLAQIIESVEELECQPKTTMPPVETTTTQAPTTTTTQTTTTTKPADPCPLDTGVVIRVVDRPARMHFWAENFDGSQITAKVIEEERE